MYVIGTNLVHCTGRPAGPAPQYYQHVAGHEAWTIWEDQLNC